MGIVYRNLNAPLGFEKSKDETGLVTCKKSERETVIIIASTSTVDRELVAVIQEN